MARSFARVSISVGREHVLGALAEGEDQDGLRAALLEAPARLLAGQARLLLHADHRRDVSADARQRQETERLERLRQGRLRRYVIRVETTAGPRIVKLNDSVSLGDRLLGWVGRSVGRREHEAQRRAEALSLAATTTLGFLELRRGANLVRSAQVQSVLEPGRETLDDLLARELGRHGDRAFDACAEALADTHGRRFFHGDLKGFHAFPVDLTSQDDGPTRYRLAWLDLGRVGFRLSERQRLINLYQALRFVVGRRPEAEERFLRAYCATARWHVGGEARALAQVRRFLDAKEKSHPHPDI